MLRYTGRRLLSSLLVLFFVSLITFLALDVIPGDQAVLSLGLEATSERLQELRETMGLDRNVALRYLEWLSRALRFDFGTSSLYGERVITLILTRLPVTLSLAFFSMVTATIMSGVLGTLAAKRKGKMADGIVRACVIFFSSLPSFWVSLLALVFFAGRLGWFPVNGYASPSSGFLQFIRSITLPSLILAMGETGLLTRMFRSSVSKALEEEYMLAAKVKGLSEGRALVRYAMRSAIIAPLTLVGNQGAKLVGGTVVVETVFSLPGIGRLLLVAVEQHDTALLQGVVVFVTTLVVLVNLITDIAVATANPLIRIEERGR